MNPKERLELIKARAKVRHTLSTVAAQVIEALREEDKDLGGVTLVSVSDSIGEVEAPNAQVFDEVDEEEKSILSPFARQHQKQDEKELAAFERDLANN